MDRPWKVAMTLVQCGLLLILIGALANVGRWPIVPLH